LRFAVVEDPAETGSSIPVHDFGALLQHLPANVENEKCIEQDLAAILYTSGSTRRPKGVMLSHANVLAGAEIVSDYLKITRKDRLLAALPFSFDAGLNQLTTAILQGGTAVMIDFRFGRDIVRKLVDERITGLAGVPSLWSLLAQPSSGLGTQSLEDLRYITNTGGAMPQNVLQQLRALLPNTDVVLMYGLTEAFRSTYLPPEELDQRPTSMGKAIPNTEILVLNEDGRICNPGEVGELVHHGPTVSLGYWGHPDLTKRVLRSHPFPPLGRAEGDRVCYSGDLVRKDEEGFLYFVGRRDNQIKSAGFRISPTEVEDVICRVTRVRQAAVVGVPDAVLGQHLVAFAVPEENAQLDPADMLAKCAGVMPRHMVPKRIELVNDLPKTSSGKVNYPKLRDQLDANPTFA
jgi:acyl-CoA synthetase (AMP-forming)/AMP-acid ligase II